MSSKYGVRFLLGFLFVFFLLGTSGCQYFKRFLNRPKLNTLVLGFVDSRFSFDWHKEMNAASLLAVTHLMEGLVEIKTVGGKIQINPGLAEKWETKKDGLLWTFHLRKTRWSDGEELRAEHFVSSFRRLLSVEADSPYSELLFAVKNARDFKEGKIKFFSEVGVKAVDSRTLEFTLGQPQSVFLENLAHPALFPLRNDHQELFMGRKTNIDKIPWIGPFRLILFAKRRVQLFENENYYKSHGAIQKVDLLLDNKKEKLVQLMHERKIHISFGVESQPPLVAVISLPAPHFSYYQINLSSNVKPLKDPILRRVVALSLNREELARSMQGVQPLGGVIPPGVEGYESNRGMKYDLEMAALVLKNAKLESALSKFSYELFVDRSLGAEGFFVADFVREQLKKNLSMEVKVITSDKGTPVKDRPYFILEKIGARGLNPILYLQQRRSSWKNRNYDEFVRKEQYAKAQHLIVEEENPVVPLVSFYSQILIQPEVRGVEQNFLKLLDIRLLHIERK